MCNKYHVGTLGLVLPPMPAPTQRLDSPRCLSADEALTVCGGSDGPPPPELRSHIESCERCRVLVAEAARALVDVSGHRTGSLLTLSEGEQVAGRYRIVRFIARGGMGEVYEAFDQVLQEPVALKTLVATALDDEPEASVQPAPRSQMRMSNWSRETTRANWTLVRMGKAG